jgi:SAM-dependent methyltransferase|tara:strand:+ start:292 stop:1200 length:909 start_codon:yes stop_codon:yes gene_type:complete
MEVKFNDCEICGYNKWDAQFSGKIRDGAVGNFSNDESVILRCSKCGVERLNESCCKDADLYTGKKYRKLLSQPTTVEGFMEKYDSLQLRNLKAIWPDSVRGKTVADIGCAAGSFLDHISGLTKEVIAVEPCRDYHYSLINRGYSVYSYVNDAAGDWRGKVDYAFSFSVIEHISNPRLFLEEIGGMLSNNGKLLVSTPNRKDILMELAGDDYKRFFYRTVHRWYFDRKSFGYCADKAGFEVTRSICVHRFGLSNAMKWLRDSKPDENTPLPYLDDEVLDNFWKGYLESHGVGDYLYFELKRKE